MTIAAKAMALVGKSPEEITNYLSSHYGCKIKIRKTVTIDKVRDTGETIEVTRYKLYHVDSRPPYPATLLIREISIVGL